MLKIQNYQSTGQQVYMRNCKTPAKGQVLFIQDHKSTPKINCWLKLRFPAHQRQIRTKLCGQLWLQEPLLLWWTLQLQDLFFHRSVKQPHHCPVSSASANQLLGQVDINNINSNLAPDILRGVKAIPFKNRLAMQYLQNKDKDLFRVRNLLSAGQAPGCRESKNVKRDKCMDTKTSQLPKTVASSPRRKIKRIFLEENWWSSQTTSASDWSHPCTSI